MNHDLYTDEYRDFKYLKCPAEYVAYYKKATQDINSVQIHSEANDPNFVWPHRLEFLEQLFDLHDGTVYFVEAGMLYNQKNKQIYDYEAARLHELTNPYIFQGSIFDRESQIIATIDDIPVLENITTNKSWKLSASTSSVTYMVYDLTQNPLIPTNNITYNAMFYDKDTAERYRQHVTIFLKKNLDAVTRISTML